MESQWFTEGYEHYRMPSKHKTGNTPEIKLIEVTIFKARKNNKQTNKQQKQTRLHAISLPIGRGKILTTLNNLFEFTYLIFLDV